MNTNRRTILQSTVAAGAAVIAGLPGANRAEAATAPDATHAGHVQPLPIGMTFATIQTAQGLGLGVRDGERILDVKSAEARFKTGAPTTMDDLLQGRGDTSALPRLIAAAKAAGNGKPLFIAQKEARFGPCVLAPEKIICVGLNYKSHAAKPARSCRRCRSCSTSTTRR